MAILPKQSRSRRLQYQWLAGHAADLESSKSNSGFKVLDLGGVPNAEYHRILKLHSKPIETWNLDAVSSTKTVDLDNVKNYPDFPENCDTVLCMNVLEHLYKPLDVIEWVAKNLPNQGTFLIVVPYLYSIHPSPNDFWRISPQTFERCFADLEKTGIKGELKIEPLSKDFREASSLLTANLFKSSLAYRALGSCIEFLFWTASQCTGLFMGKKGKAQLKTWAYSNPVAIGVCWKKINPKI